MGTELSKKVKLIVAGIVVLVLGLVAANLYAKYGYAKDKAERQLAHYLAEMYSDRTLLGKNCTGLDTDGDGYISCDANTLLRNGVEEKVTVDCAATFFKSGCKTKQLLPGVIAPSAR